MSTRSETTAITEFIHESIWPGYKGVMDMARIRQSKVHDSDN